MSEPSTTFILKIAGACNLNCTYCYVYNLGDTSFLLRPRIMEQRVASAALDRIFSYASCHNLGEVAFVLHGGEPLLVGKYWMEWLFQEAHRLVPPGLRIGFALQTNGVLLDEDWLKVLRLEGVSLGISIDGPPEWHNRHRINHAGHGTYRQVRRAIDLLVNTGTAAPRWGVLTVANPEFPGVDIYRHFLDIGIRQMDFLWPDYHHDMPPPWPAGTLSRYYSDLFDVWFEAGDPSIKIRWFETAMEMLLGAKPRTDALGPQPLTEIVVETDGSLEPLDLLRTGNDGMTRLGLNVLTHDVEALRATRLFQLCLHNQDYLPEECRCCPVYSACGGGYMPHRWGRGRGFGNSSIHSVDLLNVLTHIRNRISAELNAVLRDKGGLFKWGSFGLA